MRKTLREIDRGLTNSNIIKFCYVPLDLGLDEIHSVLLKIFLKLQRLVAATWQHSVSDRPASASMACCRVHWQYLRFLIIIVIILVSVMLLTS